MKLEFANGKTIEVIRIIKGGLLDYLHIYINTLTPAEIYECFDNKPEETQILTVHETVGDDGRDVTHTYYGYTDLYGVQKPFLSSPEGTWMVWLQRSLEVISDGT